MIRFSPLSEEDIREILTEQKLVGSDEEAAALARASQGSLAKALDWRDAGFEEFREQLMLFLARPPWHPLKFAKLVQPFVDQAGKETAAKRERFLHVNQMVSDVLRLLMRRLGGAAIEVDAASKPTVDALTRFWQGGLERVANCLERCLNAEEEVHRNAHMVSLIECWSDDLGRLANGQTIHPIHLVV